MNQLDNFITNILEKNINEPKEYENAIRGTLENNKLREYTIHKLVITICSTIILTTGFSFAGYTIYEKIWKEPKKYTTHDEFVNSLPQQEISEKEKSSLINEEQAKRIAIEFMEKLGYGKQDINRIELKRGYGQSTDSYYMVKTKYDYEEGLMILVNAENGKVSYFNDIDLKYKELNQKNISEEQAKQIAIDTYKILGLNENEYELYSVNQENSNFENKIRKLWGVTFLKKENEIYNKYASISISFIVVNNKVVYDTIHISSEAEEVNNPIIIEDQTAIEIAKEKERELTDVEISSVVAEISIEKMNTFIYQLENEIYNTDPDSGGTYLDIENKTRKVWKVLIKHDKKEDESMYSNYNQYIKTNYNKEYYIDVTTGEIIGGNTNEIR